MLKDTTISWHYILCPGGPSHSDCSDCHIMCSGMPRSLTAFPSMAIGHVTWTRKWQLLKYRRLYRGNNGKYSGSYYTGNSNRDSTSYHNSKIVRVFVIVIVLVQVFLVTLESASVFAFPGSDCFGSKPFFPHVPYLCDVGLAYGLGRKVHFGLLATGQTITTLPALTPNGGLHRTCKK